MPIKDKCNKKNKSTNKLLSKTSYLLYPYIIWAIIDSLIYHNSVYNHVISKVHGGLWILLCLYEIFLLIFLLEIISSSFNKSCKFWKDIFIFGVPACILIITNKFIYQTDLAIYLNFDMLAIHYKYFIVGYLTRKYIKLHNLFDSDIFASS